MSDQQRTDNKELQRLVSESSDPAKTEAILLVAVVRAATLNGVVHTNIKTGKVLTTADEIIMGMMESNIHLDASKRVEVTTTLDEYKKLVALWEGVED